MIGVLELPLPIPKWLTHHLPILFFLSIGLQSSSEFARTATEPAAVAPMRSEAAQIWWLNPVLVADELGGQDAMFYSLGLPYAQGMQPHMFAQIRRELFGALWGKESAYAAVSKPYAALLALHGADPIFRRALPSEMREALERQDELGRKLLRAPLSKGSLQTGLAATLAGNGSAWAADQPAGAGSSGVACPQGTFTNPDGISDGCPGAPTGTVNNVTLVQHTNYFSGYANADGHKIYFRPPWNVVGADYAAGIPSSVVLADPANVSPSNMPVHTGKISCAYNPTGSALGTPQIVCDNEPGTITWANYDFSGIFIGRHGAVNVAMDTNTYQININNSFVMYDANNFGPSNPIPRQRVAAFQIAVSTAYIGPAGFNFNYSNTVQQGFTPPSVDSYYGKSVSWMGLISPSAAAPAASPEKDPTQVNYYNVFHGTSGNPIDGGICSLDFRWNYVDTFALGNGVHGEIVANKACQGKPDAPYTHHRTWYLFNNGLAGQQMPGQGSTSFIWFSNGTHTNNVNLLDPRANNNVFVNQNSVVGNHVGWAPAGLIISFEVMETNPVAKDNFMDRQKNVSGYFRSTGQCVNPIVFSGNFDFAFPKDDQPRGTNSVDGRQTGC